MSVPSLPSLVLMGATAVGKDDVALPLAEAIHAEIVSVDSIKVYRRMDVGSAKPTPEARRRVRHHLIDVAEPWESYSAGRFAHDAAAAAGDIRARGSNVLYVGGSGLYLKALLEGLMGAPATDPELRRRLAERADQVGSAALHAELAQIDATTAARLHPNDRKRILRALEFHALTGQPISSRQTQQGKRRTDEAFLLYSVRRPREELRRRACARVDAMVAQGLVEEVRRLLADPRGLGPQAAEAIGYRELVQALTAGTPVSDAITQIVTDTCQFLKRQETWFRHFPDLRWFDLDERNSPEQVAAEIAADAISRSRP